MRGVANGLSTAQGYPPKRELIGVILIPDTNYYLTINYEDDPGAFSSDRAEAAVRAIAGSVSLAA